MSSHGATTEARLGAALAGAMLVARGQSLRCEIGATSKTSISALSGAWVCGPTGRPDCPVPSANGRPADAR